MTPTQYSYTIQKYVDKYFVSNKDAAEFFGCSPSTVSNVKKGIRSPTAAMLKATGHVRRDVVKTQYIKLAVR